MRIVIWTFVAISILAAFAYLIHDGDVLAVEPEAGSIPTGDTRLVYARECGWGQVEQITGSVAGVERTRECVAYPRVSFASLWVVREMEIRLGRIYDLLVVLGTVFAGVGALLAAWRFLRKTR